MKILEIAFKDVLRSLRSYFLLGMALAAPLAITGLIYLAFGGLVSGSAEMPVTRVGVVNLDQAPDGLPALGEDLQAMLSDESVSSWLQTSSYPDENSARQAVNRQELALAVIIPADFTRSLLLGEGEAALTLVEDPTLTIAPLVVENMLTSFVDGIRGAGNTLQVAQARLQPYGVTLAQEEFLSIASAYSDWYVAFQRALFHSPDAALVMQPLAAGETESRGSMQQLISLIMTGQMIFFAFFTGAYAMGSILSEEEEGTLARLFTTPTARTAILGGKFLAVALTVTLQSLTMLAVGSLLFGVAWGAPGRVLLCVLAQVMAATGLGVLLISFVKTSRQTGPVLGGALSALGMLGGLFTVAVPNLPAAFTRLHFFTPQGWVLNAWKLCLGAATGNLFISAGAAALMGAGMFAVGAFFFRRRFA